jgi:phosphoribosylglycinamide formyltransferase 2
LISGCATHVVSEYSNSDYVTVKRHLSTGSDSQAYSIASNYCNKFSKTPSLVSVDKPSFLQTEYFTYQYQCNSNKIRETSINIADKSEEDKKFVWDYAINNSRGDIQEVIIESFVSFHTEITLLTVTQNNGMTLFCPAIGHRQERGDYQESWQPCAISKAHYDEACQMAEKVTSSLTGAGIWGVEFFLTDEGVYFSELSPRPHDTGMVTLAGTQNLSEFELHARAILGFPIPEIKLEKSGVSALILAEKNADSYSFSGIEEALTTSNTDIRLFGKPSTRMYRRMGVVLVNDVVESDMISLRKKAIEVAGKVRVD